MGYARNAREKENERVMRVLLPVETSRPDTLIPLYSNDTSPVIARRHLPASFYATSRFFYLQTARRFIIARMRAVFSLGAGKIHHPGTTSRGNGTNGPAFLQTSRRLITHAVVEFRNYETHRTERWIEKPRNDRVILYASSRPDDIRPAVKRASTFCFILLLVKSTSHL